MKIKFVLDEIYTQDSNNKVSLFINDLMKNAFKTNNGCSGLGHYLRENGVLSSQDKQIKSIAIDLVYSPKDIKYESAEYSDILLLDCVPNGPDVNDARLPWSGKFKLTSVPYILVNRIIKNDRIDNTVAL